MRLRTNMLLIFALAAALFAFGLPEVGARESAVPVSVVKAGKHRIEQILELTGSIEAFRAVTVYSKVTGVIEKLLVERGMTVKKGDIIAVVEHEMELAQRKELLAAVEAAQAGVRQAEAAVETAEVQVRQAEAGVETAEAGLKQAEASLANALLEKERAEKLYARGNISKRDYDGAMTQYKVAAARREMAAAQLKAARVAFDLAKAGLKQAQTALESARVGLKQAKAALARLDVRIADYTIRAPISGAVTARFVEQGAMDNPALPIVEIMDLSVLKVLCDVPQVDAAKVKKGQKARIVSDAYPGVEFEGEVAIVNPSLDPRTRTLSVEIHTTGEPNGGNVGAVRLRPGMFAKLQIGVGSKTALAVPRDCLMRLPATGVYYVFVVKDGKAEKRIVETGLSRGNFVEIVSGLREGEQVVIKGQINLKSGVSVVVTD